MKDPYFPNCFKWRMCTNFIPADVSTDFGNYAIGSLLLSVEYIEASDGKPFWRLLIAVPYLTGK